MESELQMNNCKFANAIYRSIWQNKYKNFILPNKAV